MSSSLLNPSLLGFDLVRRPGGARVARLVRSALVLRPSDLEMLAAFAMPDSPQRQDAWMAIATHEDEHSAIALLADVRDALAREDVKTATAGVGALQEAPLGTLDDLLRLVRTEVLDWTWRRAPGAEDGELAVQDTTAGLATTVICDAVAASYLEHRLDDVTRRTLCGPWLRGSRLMDSRVDDLGARSDEVTNLLARLRLLTRREWQALEVAAAEESATSWARAAHDATWAAVLTDRLKASTAAQMRLVEVLADAPVDLGPLASGVWNAVSGAVLEAVTGDVLPAVAARRLRAPVQAVLTV